MVGVEALLRIMRSCLEVLTLHSARRHMPFAAETSFLRRRFMPDAARSARIGDATVVDDRRVVDNRLIAIDIVKSAADVHDRRVVEEVSPTPVATGEADTHVAEAIVHAAVVANVRAPVAFMEDVGAAFISPVGRGPQQPGLGSRHPRTRNPVIAGVAVGPVSRRPKPAIFRADRLFINRQDRRSNVNADKNSGKRRCRNQRKQQSHQVQAS